MKEVKGSLLVKKDANIEQRLSALFGKQGNIYCAQAEVDFVTAEPAHNDGDIYLNTVTGGSFTEGNLYLSQGGQWDELVPSLGWVAVFSSTVKRFDGSVWVEVGASESVVGYQTTVETLTYGAAVADGVFATSIPQGTSANQATIEPIRVVRQYIGDGKAAVSIHVGASFLQYDDDLKIFLPPGTIAESFHQTMRGFRSQLNVSAYIVASASLDEITVNRDDNIDGNSPFYLTIEGVGDWKGPVPGIPAEPVVTVGLQAQEATLTPDATLSDSTFTTSVPQGTGTGQIDIKPVRITRSYIGDGKASVALHFDITSLPHAVGVDIALPAGTLTDAFQEVRRYYPPVAAGTVVTVTATVDNVRVIKSSPNNAQIPFTFVVEGIGNWEGPVPGTLTESQALSYEILDVATSAVTAEFNKILPVDSSAGSITVAPPSSPSSGAWIAVSDALLNAATNPITIDLVGAGQPIHGISDNFVIDTTAGFVKLIYVNATVGWIIAN